MYSLASHHIPWPRSPWPLRRLLVQNRIAEFHTELELLPEEVGALCRAAPGAPLPLCSLAAAPAGSPSTALTARTAGSKYLREHLLPSVLTRAPASSCPAARPAAAGVSARDWSGHRAGAVADGGRVQQGAPAAVGLAGACWGSALLGPARWPSRAVLVGRAAPLRRGWLPGPIQRSHSAPAPPACQRCHYKGAEACPAPGRRKGAGTAGEGQHTRPSPTCAAWRCAALPARPPVGRRCWRRGAGPPPTTLPTSWSSSPPPCGAQGRGEEPEAHEPEA